MASKPADSIDSIVTDPPYGLEFMGKDWDSTSPVKAVWQACLQVAKPGAHLLAFGGTRTFHRLVCAIEDAGWEIRDTVMWVYGSGFPKSLDVSKAIDKAAGIEREDKFEGSFQRRAGPTGNRKCDVCGKWLVSGSPCQCPRPQDAAQSDAAKQWQGWGTALKPAYELIVVARKPLIGTVAENVQVHGTGALNIDGCRIETTDSLGGGAETETRADQKGNDGWTRPWMNDADARLAHAATVRANVAKAESLGRWPANLIHDGSEEVVALFPQAIGVGHTPATRGKGGVSTTGHGGQQGIVECHYGIGSTARFFYCPKASKSERNSNGAQNNHPTVKPVELMRYLCRLVTPPGGLVLDPFCGSGSTGRAALLEGFEFIGIECVAEYVAIARTRVAVPVKRKRVQVRTFFDKTNKPAKL